VRESVVSESRKPCSRSLAGVGKQVAEERQSVLRSSQSSGARHWGSQLIVVAVVCGGLSGCAARLPFGSSSTSMTSASLTIQSGKL